MLLGIGSLLLGTAQLQELQSRPCQNGGISMGNASFPFKCQPSLVVASFAQLLELLPFFELVSSVLLSFFWSTSSAMILPFEMFMKPSTSKQLGRRLPRLACVPHAGTAH
jgi:hypothetical protein